MLSLCECTNNKIKLLKSEIKTGLGGARCLFFSRRLHASETTTTDFVAQGITKKNIFTREFWQDMKFKAKKKANNGRRISGRIKRQHTTKWNKIKDWFNYAHAACMECGDVYGENWFDVDSLFFILCFSSLNSRHSIKMATNIDLNRRLSLFN